MKKKFIIFTLCFTLIFSSLNFKKSYADGGVISLPILATVSALAVGTGIVIQGNDDLFDIGRMFYDYIDKSNDLAWSTVQSVFASSVSLQANKLVSVKSDFLDIVKGFFDSVFSSSSDVVVGGDIACYPSYYDLNNAGDDYGSIYIYNSGGLTYVNFRSDVLGSRNLTSFAEHLGLSFVSVEKDLVTIRYYNKLDGSYTEPRSISAVGHSIVLGSAVFPYNGGYTWDNLESKREEDKSVSLPVPGNLGNLVDKSKDDFWGNTNDLVGDKPLTYPTVDNPSINVDSSTTFPGVDSGVVNPSVPNEGIFSDITDYIIGLVVPSDTFWTDAWGGLYNSFTSSFPMVNMDGFNDLVTGEKKFPNIDITIMGSKGRVVNGDIVNSIVDWLRPIIAGFIMLCLMFFNYRKIYKLIRNSEPFEGIGKVEHHAN